MKEIVFDWLPGKSPVTISSKLEMPDYILTEHNPTVCQRKTSTGKYIRYPNKVKINIYR